MWFWICERSRVEKCTPFHVHISQEKQEDIQVILTEIIGDVTTVVNLHPFIKKPVTQMYK